MSESSINNVSRQGASTPDGAASPRRTLPFRNLWFLMGSAVVITVGYIAVGFWEYSPMGNSLPNTIQPGLIALIPFLLAFWMAFLAGWGRLGMAVAAITLMTLVGGAIAAVREVEFDGDMRMTFHYRWQPSLEDRITRHRQEQEPATSELTKGDEARVAFHKDFRIDPQDMSDFRGRNREGIIEGPALSADWKTKPPVEKWRIPVGAGYSSMAVVDNRLITLEQRGDQEAVACYDATTGTSLWEHLYPARFYEAMGGLGPRATPVVDESGRVYTLGGEGDAFCLDLFDGKVLWHHQLLQEYNLPNVTWAMSSSPLLYKEKVIFNAGSETGRGLIAYERETGRMIWEAEGLSRASHTKNLCGYSSPSIMTLAGKEQILHFDGAGLGGYDIESGKTLWFYPYENSAGVNVAQPLVLSDDQVFITASYNHGAALIKISNDGEEFESTQVWTSPRSMRCKFTSPVLYQGIAYGLDEGILMAVDPVKNDVKWKKGRYGHGQLLLSHSRLFILTEKGQMVLVQATPESWQELASLQVLSDSVKVWNPPVLVGNKAFVRDHHEMACYELPIENAKKD